MPGWTRKQLVVGSISSVPALRHSPAINAKVKLDEMVSRSGKGVSRGVHAGEGGGGGRSVVRFERAGGGRKQFSEQGERTMGARERRRKPRGPAAIPSMSCCILSPSCWRCHSPLPTLAPHSPLPVRGGAPGSPAPSYRGRRRAESRAEAVSPALAWAEWGLSAWCGKGGGG
eukprot:scaffold212097_cov30-Tisochrysis_lutea.AAC.1